MFIKTRVLSVQYGPEMYGLSQALKRSSQEVLIIDYTEMPLMKFKNKHFTKPNVLNKLSEESP